MKILLVRTSAMGDIVHCLPVLNALRRARPHAQIAWLVERTWAPILEDHPDIDQLIRVDTKKWRRQGKRQTIADMLTLRAELKKFAPDVAVDLMGNHKGALLARWSGAQRTLGSQAAQRREGSSALWIGETVATPAVHAVDRALQLLPALGIQAGDADFAGDRLLANEPPEATKWLAGQRQSGRPLVLIQPGAGWANKIYPMPRWAEVARQLHQRASADVWLPTAPGEEHLGAEIAQLSEGCARTVDATSFPFFASLLRASSLLLGGDTGPVHLAHALGTPVLCLIGPTDPRRNGPYNAPERVLFHELPCSYCYKRLDGPRPCLLNITPQMVTERALELLAD